jgi:hypothetical protein
MKTTEYHLSIGGTGPKIEPKVSRIQTETAYNTVRSYNNTSVCTTYYISPLIY